MREDRHQLRYMLTLLIIPIGTSIGTVFQPISGSIWFHMSFMLLQGMCTCIAFRHQSDYALKRRKNRDCCGRPSELYFTNWECTKVSSLEIPGRTMKSKLMALKVVYAFAASWRADTATWKFFYPLGASTIVLKYFQWLQVVRKQEVLLLWRPNT